MSDEDGQSIKMAEIEASIEEINKGGIGGLRGLLDQLIRSEAGESHVARLIGMLESNQLADILLIIFRDDNVTAMKAILRYSNSEFTLWQFLRRKI